MTKLNRAGATWLMAMLMLSLLALTNCSVKHVTTVLPEAKTAKVKAGEPAPFDGWILTDGTMAEILEAGERCVGKATE